MARLQGTRNARYVDRRAELLALLRTRLEQPGPAPSWRELAAAAGVSLSTLSHYFGRREHIVQAVMDDDLKSAAEPLEAMSNAGSSFAHSIAEAVEHLANGFRHGGLGALFARGLIEGLRHDTIGPAFLHSALEPTLSATERRLQAHIDRGQMRAVDPRGPAISLVAPVVLACLHQQQLGGESVRPLDTAAFFKEHASAFVKAWQADEKAG